MFQKLFCFPQRPSWFLPDRAKRQEAGERARTNASFAAPSVSLFFSQLFRPPRVSLVSHEDVGSASIVPHSLPRGKVSHFPACFTFHLTFVVS